MITFGGLASGLDTGAIIQQLLAVEARPLQRLDQRRADLLSQQGQFDTFRSKLTKLESAITDLSDTDELSLFTSSTTDDKKVRISAGAGAVPGAFDVEVQNLAKAKSEAYAFKNKDTDTYGEGKLDFTVDGDLVSINIADTDTLEDIRDKINAGDAGVRASIINDGTDFQLVISSEETGVNNAFSVAASGFGGQNPLTILGPAQALETAADANFTVGGLAITSETNSVENVLDGVTFELLAETGGTPVEVTIARDDTAIGDRLDEVIDAYNDVISFIEAQDRNDVSLRGIKSQLDQAFHSQLDANDGFDLTALSQAGITTRNGRLELDRGDLEDAIDNDFNAVLELFAGKADGSADGISARLDEVFNGNSDPVTGFAGILSPGDGALVLRQNSIGDRIRSVDAQIDIAERRLDRSEQALTRRFASFETLQSQFQSQGAFLSALQL